MLQQSVRFTSAPFAAALVCLTVVGCHGGGSTSGVGNGTTTGGQTSNQNTLSDARPSVASYVGKVKTLLTSEPPTDDEIASVTADANNLQALVKTWMQTDQYQSNMRDFYATAFQQQVDTVSANSFGVAPENGIVPNLLSNIQDSFGYTVEELNAESQPFTQVLTTPRYMMTLPLMMLYAFVDSVQYGDNDTNPTNDLMTANPNLVVYIGSASVASTSSSNPNDPNFMHWTFPAVAGLTYSASSPNSCYGTDPIALSQARQGGKDMGYIPGVLFDALMGKSFRFNQGGGAGPCTVASGALATPFITSTDYTTWRMINVRTPNKGEATTKFYEIDKLRSATEIVLHNPPVGFFGTYAFQSLWQTNPSNQFRVTMNQALIVALGQAFDGTDQTKPQSLAALDASHAVPGTACYSCHLTLDPMRQFFHQTYTFNSAQQQDPNFTKMPGQFAWDGVSVAGNSLTDLGNNFASSPRFASSWVQKLCTYARSSPCSADDPAFLQIVSDFKSGGYNFDAMAAELFASPLITYAQATKTEADTGQVYAVKKQSQMCAALSERMGINDACHLALGTPAPAALQPVRVVQTTLASDSYSRGSVAPTQANDPGLLFFSGMENACKALANDLVDNGKNSRYSSNDAQTAIADMVHTLMGINPARDAVPMQLLQQHYATAQQQSGQTPTTALQSTFVLACMAPSTLSLGQ